MRALLATLALSSGLFGHVTRGPLTPVCTVGIPCSGPAPGITLEFKRGETVARRTVTDARGRYSISLGPGTYTVRAFRASKPVLRFAPLKAVVAANARSRVDFTIDTGIR